jgi:hypothetical protein
VIIILRVCRRGRVERWLTYHIILGGKERNEVKGELHDDDDQKEIVQVNDCLCKLQRTRICKHGSYNCLSPNG